MEKLILPHREKTSLCCFDFGAQSVPYTAVTIKKLFARISAESEDYSIRFIQFSLEEPRILLNRGSQSMVRELPVT
jgi:hypothetical protein